MLIPIFVTYPTNKKKKKNSVFIFFNFFFFSFSASFDSLFCKLTKNILLLVLFFLNSMLRRSFSCFASEQKNHGNNHGVTEIIEKWTPTVFYKTSGLLACSSVALLGAGYPIAGGALTVLTAAFFNRGIKDMRQTKHTLLRNFPVLGHMRYTLEAIRPEIRQYFIEDDTTQAPFSREQRALIYARAKGTNDNMPFGTKKDIYAEGYSYVLHSLFPKPKIPLEDARVVIGAGNCEHPYSASLLNTSAMSYGALSPNAVRAFGRGAKLGGYFQNTGEGGLSPYHLENGNDLVFNMGTGYFSVRTEDGQFCEEKFKEVVGHPQVKMIEIKLSQGAKPSKGGVLPKEKITEEISKIRQVPMGKDCISPSSHSEFDSPHSLLQFAERLRKISGKPVGIKLCIGDPVEIASIVRASMEMKKYLDFITVDGAEGGTGAAPVEHSNFIGMSSLEGLYFVHNLLRGAGIRQHTKVIVAGKVVNGFSLFRFLHQGADLCNAARGFMFSIGCIQSLSCAKNTCPVGVATSDPVRYMGLDPTDKGVRAANFQRATVESCLDIIAGCGFSALSEVRNRPVLMIRTSHNDAHFSSELYPKLKDRELIELEPPKERLVAAFKKDMTIKDRLINAWHISGDVTLQPKISLYMRRAPMKKLQQAEGAK